MSDEERNERDVNDPPATSGSAGDAHPRETSAGAPFSGPVESTPLGERAHNAQSDRPPPKGRRIIKWAALIIGLLFFLAVLREAMDPFGDDPYVAISHGDHVHYVPADRDPNVPIGRFPRAEPAADERITPDGRVVKRE